MATTKSTRLAFKKDTYSISTVILMCWFTGCGPSHSQPQVSQVRHTPAEPTRASYRGQWIELDDAQYRSTVLAMNGLEKSSILPEDDLVTMRLQFWLDEIDQAIRRLHPDLLTGVPRPKAKILASTGKNASVSAAPVCYSLGVDLSGLKVSESSFVNTTKSTPQMHIDLGTGRIRTRNAACVDAGADVQKLEEIFAHYNAQSEDCKYQIKDGKVMPTQSCLDVKNIGGFLGADKVVVNQTTNIITVLAGIIPVMSEHEIAGFLAHELGHYYRSHPNAPSTQYNYFYPAGRRNLDQKPLADSSLSEIGTRAIAATKSLASHDAFARVPEQKLNSELFLAVTGLVKDICKAGSCSDACLETKQLVDDPVFIADITRFPYVKKLEAVTQTAYRRFEPSALACLSTVAFTADDTQAEAGAVNWQTIASRIVKPHNPWWTNTLPMTVWWNFNADLPNRLTDLAKNFSNAAEAVMAASQKLDDYNAGLFKVLQDAQHLSLGHYTVEQEADDFAIEWMAKIGVDPQHLIKAMWKVYGANQAFGGFNYSKSQCEEAYSKNWLDENGHYVFTPVGDYTASHHGVCYRIFNITREIEAHAIAPIPRDPSLVPAPAAWETIQEKAKAFSQTW